MNQGTPSQQLSSEEAEKLALEHAWKLFELHANQRMAGFRHFLILTAIAFAIFGNMWKEEEYFICGIVSLIYLLASFGFWALDIRVLELIHLAEEIMMVSQRRLRDAVPWPEDEARRIEFFKLSNNETYFTRFMGKDIGQITYRSVFRKMFRMMIILSIAGASISFYLALSEGEAAIEPPGVAGESSTQTDVRE